MAWTKEMIIDRIEKSDKMMLKCVAEVYKQQTPDEVKSGQAVEENGIGFNKFDAPFLSEIAEKFTRNEKLEPSEIALARLKIKKYWRQLVDLANDAQIKINVAADKNEKVETTQYVENKSDELFDAEINKVVEKINARFEECSKKSF